MRSPSGDNCLQQNDRLGKVPLINRTKTREMVASEANSVRTVVLLKEKWESRSAILETDRTDGQAPGLATVMKAA